jgi:hypothetical protein
MLTWMGCSDGRQTARATPFRDKGRIVEIGGWYCIEPFDVEGQRCFRLSYYPTLGAKVELGALSFLPHSSSSSRFTAGASGFLNFSQSFERPEAVARAEPLRCGPRSAMCFSCADCGERLAHGEGAYAQFQSHAILTLRPPQLPSQEISTALEGESASMPLACNVNRNLNGPVKLRGNWPGIKGLSRTSSGLCRI